MSADTAANTNTANTRRLSLKNLYLDPNNFRLIHEVDQVQVSEDKIKDKTVAQRTFKLLCGERNQHIQDLLDSFKANGYLPVDQIQVRALADGGGFVVIEGNRRVAALKYLQQKSENDHIELGQLDPAIFSAVPVVMYTDANEVHHLTLMALKHISGNKKWGDWNQAKLLEKLAVEYKLNENQICLRIGISMVELRRNLRALSLVQQYIDSEYGDQFKENQFSMFKEVVRKADLKEWLGWDEGKRSATNNKNATLFFSWLSREPDDNDHDNQDSGDENNPDDESSNGMRYLEPILTRRDDIRLLDEIIKDSGALNFLIKHRDLTGAHRNSSQVFQQRKNAALQSLTYDVGALQQLNLDKKNLPDMEKVMNQLQSIIARTKGSHVGSVEQNQVFHDKLDAHFTGISIAAYRKLSGLSLSKLARINLFAGINNTGKTSLLEAIYLLVKQNDVDGILEAIRRRGKIAADQMQQAWLSNQLLQDVRISGEFDKMRAEVAIRAYEETSANIDRSRYLKSIEISTVFGHHKQESMTRLFQDRGRETLAEGIKMLCPIVYSSPFFLNEPQHHTQFYYRSVQSKALPAIFKFLQERVVPTVADIRLVDDLQRFLVTDSKFDQAADLSNYGEGFQRIFFISLIFAAAQHGVVLIDEFENAIHADLLPVFAAHILALAKLFNVQVFLTSHSKEAIDAFAQDATQLSEFSFHALVNQDDKIMAHHFTGEEFKDLLAIGNVDLRRAQ
jgi:hypothetical protein